MRASFLLEISIYRSPRALLARGIPTERARHSRSVEEQTALTCSALSIR